MIKAFLHGTIVSMNGKKEIFRDAGILWEDDRIIALGAAKLIEKQAHALQAEVENFHGKVMFPGLVNTHAHLFQSLLKGIGPDRAMEDWWTASIGRYAPYMTEEDLKAAALAGMMEAIRSGTTTLLDYAYVHPVKQASDVIIDSAKELKMRLVFGRGFNVSSLFVPALLREPLDVVFADALRLREKLVGSEVDLWLAPAVNWCMNPEELFRLGAFCRKERFPVTMHLMETNSDQQIWHEEYGRDLWKDLQDSGLLDERFLAVHFVQVDDQDIQRLADCGASVSHNALSNMILASGICPLSSLRDHHIPISLGTDGAASNNTLNMLETLKVTALLQKVAHRTPDIVSAMEVLDMATMGGARALGKEKDIGSLEVGKKADFFLLDPLSTLTTVPMHDPVATLVYSSGPEAISDVYIGGIAIIKQHQFLGMDEKNIIETADRCAKALIGRAGGYHD